MPGGLENGSGSTATPLNHLETTILALEAAILSHFAHPHARTSHVACTHARRATSTVAVKDMLWCDDAWCDRSQLQEPKLQHQSRPATSNHTGVRSERRDSLPSSSARLVLITCDVA